MNIPARILTLAIAASLCACVPGAWHRVKPGQTLDCIAKGYGVSKVEIVRINHRNYPELASGKVYSDTDIFIPGAFGDESVPTSCGGATVAASGGSRNGGAAPRPPEVRSSRPPTTPAIAVSPPPQSKDVKFIWPVTGRLESRFGKRDQEDHQGLDIGAPPGTPIKAAAGGKVIYANNGIRGYGNLIIVKHAGVFVSVYAHNRENLVKEGQLVEQGQEIAKVGQTGKASGPHLHFEVRVNNSPKDPLGYLPPITGGRR